VSERLVLSRLWPMLAVLALLVAGALAIEGYAARRGNDVVAVAIAAADADAAGADDEETAATEAGPADPPLSPEHERARLAARRALHAEAIPMYERLVAAHPGSAPVRAELGALLLRDGQAARALPLLADADRLRPTAQSALQLGLARARAGDAAGAEQDLRRALALRPGLSAAAVALGNLLRRRGAVDEALAVLAPAVSAGSNEERARGHVAVGAAQLAAGRRAEAERAFARAVEFAPARAEIRLGIARAWLSTGDREGVARALAVVARAAELAPDVAAVHAALGRARERAGDTAGAADAYDRALRLDPDLRLARRRLLRLALQSRDHGRARHEAERLVASDPRDPEHHFLAALVADRDGRVPEARRGYQKAIELAKGDYPEAWLNLGVLERGAGDPAAARTAYARALQLRPGYAAAWLNLGRLHEGAGAPADAEAAYRKAIAADAGYAPAWLALGQLLSERGRTDEAVAALRSAMAARPGYEAAHLSLGVALARAKRHGEAVDAYRALLARSPRYVSAWFDLGLALRASGRADEAREAFARAVALDADHLASRRALAELDLEAGRVEEARAGLQEVLDRAPGDAAARAALAKLSPGADR